MRLFSINKRCNLFSHFFKRIILAAGFLFFTGISNLWGATYTWLGTTDNDWNTASNWKGGTVPNVYGGSYVDIVVGDTGYKNYLELPSSISINSLRVNHVSGAKSANDGKNEYRILLKDYTVTANYIYIDGIVAVYGNYAGYPFSCANIRWGTDSTIEYCGSSASGKDNFYTTAPGYYNRLYLNLDDGANFTFKNEVFANSFGTRQDKSQTSVVTFEKSLTMYGGCVYWLNSDERVVIGYQNTDDSKSDFDSMIIHFKGDEIKLVSDTVKKFLFGANVILYNDTAITFTKTDGTYLSASGIISKNHFYPGSDGVNLTVDASDYQFRGTSKAVDDSETNIFGKFSSKASLSVGESSYFPGHLKCKSMNLEKTLVLKNPSTLILTEGESTFNGKVSGNNLENSKFTASPDTMVFKSAIDFSKINFDANGGTIVIDGTSQVTASASTVLNNVQINSGKKLTSSSSIKVNGNWLNSGTSSCTNGTVTFQNAAAHSIAGNNTWYNLVISPLAGGTDVTFEAGKTQTVNSKFTSSGTLTNKINLISDTPGSLWLLKTVSSPTASNVSVKYTNIKDSKSTYNIIPYVDVAAYYNTNGGNTFNWFKIQWTGDAGSAGKGKWNIYNNWSGIPSEWKTGTTTFNVSKLADYDLSFVTPIPWDGGTKDIVNWPSVNSGVTATAKSLVVGDGTCSAKLYVDGGTIGTITSGSVTVNTSSQLVFNSGTANTQIVNKGTVSNGTGVCLYNGGYVENGACVTDYDAGTVIYKSDVTYSANSTGTVGSGSNIYFANPITSDTDAETTVSFLRNITFDNINFAGKINAVFTGKTLTCNTIKMHAYNNSYYSSANFSVNLTGAKLSAVNGDFDRASATDNITGTINFNCDADFSGNIFTHSGIDFAIPSGKTVTADKLLHGAGISPFTVVEVQGNLNVASTIQLGGYNSNVGSTRLLVRTGGTVTCPVITNSTATFNNDNKTSSSIENNGTINVVSELKTPSNGTINNKGVINVTGTSALVSFGKIQNTSGSVNTVNLAGGSISALNGSKSSIIDLNITGSEEISGEFAITNLNIDTSASAAVQTVKFPAEKTTEVAGTIFVKGSSVSNYVLLTTSDDSTHKKWLFNISGGTKPDASNFEYTKVSYSDSVDASGNPYKLEILESADKAMEGTPGSTLDWFNQEFYWYGSNDTSWTTAGNWKVLSGAVYVTSSVYPSYSTGLSKIVIQDNDSNKLLLENDIKINTLLVKNDKTVDFAGFNVNAEKITNNGVIRLKGSELLKKSDGTGTTLDNGNSTSGWGTVEYYGGTAGSPCTVASWGTEYGNLLVTGAASISTVMNVENETEINASGLNVSMNNGSNTFKNNVTVTAAGDVVLNNDDSVLLPLVSADCGTLTCNGKISLSGSTVTTTGNQLYEKDIETNGTGECRFIVNPSAASSITLNGAIANKVSSTNNNLAFGVNPGTDNSKVTLYLNNNINNGAVLNSRYKTVIAAGKTIGSATQNYYDALEINGAVNFRGAVDSSNTSFNSFSTVTGLSSDAALKVSGSVHFGDGTGEDEISGLKSIEITKTMELKSSAVTTTDFFKVNGNVTLTVNNISTEKIIIAGTTETSGINFVTGLYNFQHKVTNFQTGDASHATYFCVGNMNSDTQLLQDGEFFGPVKVGVSLKATGNMTFHQSAETKTASGIVSCNGNAVFENTVKNGKWTIGGDCSFADVPLASDVVDVNTISVTGNTNSAAHSVKSSGIQTYTGAVTITNATNNHFSSTGADVPVVKFGSTVSGAAENLEISGAVEFDGAVTVKQLTVNNDSLIKAGTVTSTGTQTYSGTVTLLDNLEIQSGNSNVDFSNGIISQTDSWNLTLSQNGTTTLSGDAGSVATPLGNISVTGGSLSVSGAGVSSVYCGNFTLDSSEFNASEYTNLVCPSKNISLVDSVFNFQKGILNCGDISVDASSSFIQKGINTADGTSAGAANLQSVGAISNEGVFVWDKNAEGGTLVLNGSITGGKGSEIAFNKKNVTVNSDISISGIFWDLIIPAGKTVTNSQQIAVRRNLTVNGNYIHNSKPLVLGEITSNAITYDSAQGIISGSSASINLGNCNLTQRTTKKTFSAPVTFVALSLDDTSASGGEIVFEKDVVAAGISNAASTSFNITAKENLSVTDAVTFNTTGNIVLGTASDDAFVFTAGISIPFSEKVTLAGKFETSSGNFDIAKPVELASEVSVTAGTNNIVYGSSVSGEAFDFTNSASEINFSDSVKVKSILNTGITNAGGAEVKTSASQQYNGNIVLLVANKFTGSELTFNGNVTGSPYDFEIISTAENISLAASKSMNVKSITFKNNGILRLNAGSSVTASGNIIQNGSGLVQLASALNSTGGKISFASDVFVDGEASLEAINGTEAGKNFYISCESKSVLLNSNTSVTENFALFNGNLSTAAGITLSAGKDIILLSGDVSSMNADSTTGVTDLFAYHNSQRTGKTAEPSLAVYPSEMPDGTAISHSSAYKSAVSIGNNGIISTAGNFYDNGVALENAAGWTLNIPDNDKATDSFAELYKAQISGCTVTSSGSASLSACEGTDGGSNTGVYFSRPVILANDAAKSRSLGAASPEIPGLSGTYTVYDNVIRVEFVDSLTNASTKIENTNNEISKAVSNIKFYDGENLTSFSGTFIDAECLNSTDGKGDIAVFYIKTPAASKYRWNTDAQKITNGESESKDAGRPGELPEHRSSIPVLNIPKALADVYESLRDEHKNRIGHYYSTSLDLSAVNSIPGKTYTNVGDRAFPVLTAVLTGQELHKDPSAGTQEYFDGHNFVEFQYSEPVTIVSLDDSVQNVQSTAALGNVSGSVGLTFAGLASTSEGSIDCGHNGGGDVSGIHSLYRKFAAAIDTGIKNQPHRIRVSIAGYVSESKMIGGKSYYFWPGYVDSITLAAGTVTRIANDLIIDADNNPLCAVNPDTTHKLPVLSVNSSETELYGIWDTFAPDFSFHRSSDGTAEGNEISAVHEEGESYLNAMEFHIIDNGDKYPSDAEWYTQVGWCKKNLPNTFYKAKTYAADIFGGARGFDDNLSRRTGGGVRYSTVYNTASNFKYATSISASEWTNDFDTADITGGATSVMFYPADKTTLDKNIIGKEDGNYFTIKFRSDSKLSLKTTFSVKYDGLAFITDLAGNRLKGAVIRTVDSVNPKFDISIAEINGKELYVVYNKKIHTDAVSIETDLYGTKTGDSSASLRFVNINSDGSWTVCSDLSVASQKKVAFVNDHFTGIIYELSREVTLEDFKTKYLQCYSPYKGKDPSTGIKGLDVTFIQSTQTGIDSTYMLHGEAHALTDFAVGVVNPVYAYDNRQNEQGEYFDAQLYKDSSWAVHDWDAEQKNFGSLLLNNGIFVVAALKDGTADSSNLPSQVSVYYDNNPVERSVSYQYNKNINEAGTTGYVMPWRMWIPGSTSNGTIVKPFAEMAPNINPTSFAAVIGTEESSGSKNLSFDISAENLKTLSNGNQLRFIFGLDNADGSPVTICHSPVYDSTTDSYDIGTQEAFFTARLKNSSDITTVDLWSVRIKDSIPQRGGVTIRNNVINAEEGEKAIVEVVNPSDGNINVAVMTIDGNIVQYLQHGFASKGTHLYTWNGTTKSGKTVARGMYFVRVFGNGVDETRKVMVVK